MTLLPVTMYTAPVWPRPLALVLGAPIASSRRPSPSRSSMTATDLPAEAPAMLAERFQVAAAIVTAVDVAVPLAPPSVTVTAQVTRSPPWRPAVEKLPEAESVPANDWV